MGGDRFWTRESVVTYRLNRTFLRRTLSVGAAIALTGGVLPAAWAAPGTETSNQGSDANAAEVGAAGTADDVLVTIPGNHNKAMGCDADWAPGCEKAALTRDAPRVEHRHRPDGDAAWLVPEGAGLH